jgi:hypothetical protein
MALSNPAFVLLDGAALLVYGYVGYPFVVSLRRRVLPCPVAGALEPHVTVIVVDNEGHRIERRIENLLQSISP